MPDLEWNASTWDGHYDWGGRGEEWSAAWGGSEAQWFGSLYPRLHRFVPARRILEIAPGFGRWTKFLLPACEEFVGIDLSGECIEFCRSHFAKARHASFIKNDGLSLDSLDGAFDFVFSFDSLVHADLNVFESYIPAICHRLSLHGAAFLHHSNFSASGARENIHGRSETVTADDIAALVKNAGGHVFVQEEINWGGSHLHDCLTLLAERRHDQVLFASRTRRIWTKLS